MPELLSAFDLNGDASDPSRSVSVAIYRYQAHLFLMILSLNTLLRSVCVCSPPHFLDHMTYAKQVVSAYIVMHRFLHTLPPALTNAEVVR